MAENEIRRSKAVLQELLGHQVDYFAYPKGKNQHFSLADKEYVKSCGYKAALTMENSVLSRSSDFFVIGRLGVRDVSLTSF